MRRPQQLNWILFGAFLLVLLVVWFCSSELGKPLYKGRSVAFWFDEYCQGKSPYSYDKLTIAEARKAFHHLGSNAVPYLVDISSLPPESAAGKRARTCRNIWRGICKEPPIPAADFVREQADEILSDLKPSAIALLPIIDPLLNSSDAKHYRLGVHLAGKLGDGAEAVVPRLRAVLSSSDYWTRDMAIQSIEALGPKAIDAIPDLIKLFSATNNIRTRRDIIFALSNMGTNASIASLLIEKAFNEEPASTSSWKFMYCVALCRVNPENSKGWAYLTNALTSDNRSQAIWAIERIGPDAKHLIPLLFQSIDDNDPQTSSAAVRALFNLGISSGELISRIKKRALGFGTASLVLSMDPTDKDAIAQMTKLAKFSSSYRQIAITELGCCGPAASESIPILLDIQKTGNRRERETARRALKCIRGEDW